MMNAALPASPTRLGLGASLAAAPAASRKRGPRAGPDPEVIALLAHLIAGLSEHGLQPVPARLRTGSKQVEIEAPDSSVVVLCRAATKRCSS